MREVEALELWERREELLGECPVSLCALLVAGVDVMVDEALLEVGEVLVAEADNQVELVGPMPVDILGAVRDRGVDLPVQALRTVWGIRTTGPEHPRTRRRQCRLR